MLVQELMDRKEMKFLKRPEEVDVITGATYSKNPSQNGPTPLIIFYNDEPENDALLKVPKSLLIVEVPKSFPYESNKMVPWNYNCNYTHETSVDDLTSVGNMTRTGRFYGHDKVAQEKLLTLTNEE